MIIYKVTNKINGNCYIGKTVQNLEKRKNDHFKQSKKQFSIYFYKAIRKYGWDNFEWEVLTETDSESKLNALEKFYIATYRKMINIYNMTEGGDGGKLGYKPTNETKIKIGLSNKGKKRSLEFIQKMKERMKGNHYALNYKHSEETNRKNKERNLGRISAMKGKKHSKETKLKISKSLMGKKLSQQSLKKIIETKIKNGTNKHSEETKIKIGLANKGKPSSMKGKKHTEKAKEKLKGNKHFLNHKHTKETKQKMSEIKTQYWIDYNNKKPINTKTINDITKIIGLSRQTVYDLIVKGKIKASFWKRKIYIIENEEFNNFIRDYCRSHKEKKK